MCSSIGHHFCYAHLLSLSFCYNSVVHLRETINYIVQYLYTVQPQLSGLLQRQVRSPDI